MPALAEALRRPRCVSAVGGRALGVVGCSVGCAGTEIGTDAGTSRGAVRYEDRTIMGEQSGRSPFPFGDDHGSPAASRTAHGLARCRRNRLPSRCPSCG